jgi:hypothetical protein
MDTEKIRDRFFNNRYKKYQRATEAILLLEDTVKNIARAINQIRSRSWSTNYLDLQPLQNLYDDVVEFLPSDRVIQLDLFEPEMSDIPKKPRYIRSKPIISYIQFNLPYAIAQKLSEIGYQGLKRLAVYCKLPLQKSQELAKALVWQGLSLRQIDYICEVKR